MTPKEAMARERIADEVLAIGVISHLTSPLSIAPPRTDTRTPMLGVIASLACLGVGSVAFAATLTSTPDAPAAIEDAKDKTALTPSRAPSRRSRPTRVAPEPVVVAVARQSTTAPEPVVTPALSTVASRTPRIPTVPRTVSAPRTADRAPSSDAPVAATDASLDALLDRALGTREDAPPGVVTVSTLPETPTQAQVLTVMRALEGEVRACSEGAHATIQTRVVVDGPTGRVTRALVTGDLEGAAARACVVNVLETARFSAFSRERFEIAFPFRT